MVNADPARTPTFALFAKPDYYLYNGGTSCSGACVTRTPATPGTTETTRPRSTTTGSASSALASRVSVSTAPAPEQGPNSAGPNSGQETSVQNNNPGTWIDETDIQPTMMYLTGLRDDYTPDGRVISQILATPNFALDRPRTVRLATCYKQLNSSVGEFGAATLIADTNAIESTSSGDTTYDQIVAALQLLEAARDYVANAVQQQLTAAAFAGIPIPRRQAHLETAACNFLIDAATLLATATTPADRPRRQRPCNGEVRADQSGASRAGAPAVKHPLAVARQRLRTESSQPQMARPVSRSKNWRRSVSTNLGLLAGLQGAGAHDGDRSPIVIASVWSWMTYGVSRPRRCLDAAPPRRASAREYWRRASLVHREGARLTHDTPSHGTSNRCRHGAPAGAGSMRLFVERGPRLDGADDDGEAVGNENLLPSRQVRYRQRHGDELHPARARGRRLVHHATGW